MSREAVPNHRCGARGFTLIEVLVALVVLGFLVVGLSQAMRLGMAAWTRQNAILSATADLDGVDRALRGMLSQATAGTGEGAGFIGKPNLLRTDALLPAPVGLAGRMARIELTVDGRQRFMLRWVPVLASTRTGKQVPDEIPLLNGVARVEFFYWGVAKGRRAPGWQREWATGKVPDLIRIHLRFPPGDRRQWPDIVVAPMIEPGAT